MSTRQAGRASTASLIGTALEYYDFFIYATAAALVFDKVYFPALGGLAATLVSLSTFAVAFIVRPLGGIIVGHLGDRFGRKPMLVLTLVAMGTSTLLIGLLPGYTTLGVAAPILLVFLRIVQGFALGGEYGGAVLLTMEHAKPGRRGFFVAWMQTGGPLGLVLATLAFLPVATLPTEQLLSWGWRIPFFLSVVLLVVGFFLRTRVNESPEFEELKSADAVADAPLRTIVTKYSGRTLLAAGTVLTGGVTFYLMAVFGLSFATGVLELPRSTIMLIVLVTMILEAVLLPFLGRLADRIGTAKVFIGGVVGILLLTGPWLALLNTGRPGLILLGYLLLVLPHAANTSVVGLYLAEFYPTRVRYSGLSLSYTLGMIAGSAVAPIIAAALLASSGLVAVAVYMIAMAVVTLVCSLVLRRTASMDDNWDDSSVDSSPDAPALPEGIGPQRA